MKVRRVVADDDGNAPADEEIGHRRSLQVATGDDQALIGQDLSNATHSDTTDSDEMNSLNVLKIHSYSGLLIKEFIHFSEFFRVNRRSSC